MDEIAETRGIDPVQQALDLLGEDRDLNFAEETGGKYENYGEKIADFPWNTGRMKKVIQTVAETWRQGKRWALLPIKVFLPM